MATLHKPDRADVIIVGGGVIGCAIAAELADHYPDVFLLEALPKLGMLTSTRNSGVIHSGLYYPPGSLKARHCVEGNRLLYEFCAAHEVPCRPTGKLIVATTPEEESQLDALIARGRENGVEGLEMLSAAAVARREPQIKAKAGLRVPSAGLVESEGLVKALAAQAARKGAHIATSARMETLEPSQSAIRVKAGQAGDIETRVLVNAAGLYADEVAALCGNSSYRIYPCRGEYWEVAAQDVMLAHDLIYPAPDPTGLYLGVHLTRTLAGTLLAGPNARYIERKDDYEKGLEPREEFCRRVQKLLPNVSPSDLRPAFSGIRPKLTAPGKKGQADFVVERDAAHPNIIHLVGIESPGLTAALSLANTVTAMAAETLD
jgi:glycerol-3-phosphate dehydrogenase